MSYQFWDIRREGRAWGETEALLKLDILPPKLELLRGKLCLDETHRLELLTALLENVGLDAAVRLADVELWVQALVARLAEEPQDRAEAANPHRLNASFRAETGPLVESWSVTVWRRLCRKGG